jgi:signal peptidase I
VPAARPSSLAAVSPEPNDPVLGVDDRPPAGPPLPPRRAGAALPPPAPPRRLASRWVLEAVAIVAVAVLVAVLLRAFVVQTFYIPSGSMEPTLQIGDRIVVNKLSYHFHGVDRGDIIVFSRPAAENCGGPEVNDLVKRVIGLPGDVVSLSGGYVDVDGRRLDESWLPPQEQGQTQPGPGGTSYNLLHAYRVPADDYFVMGDNRANSCDSRYWGPIPKSLIVGKVDLRVWPFSAVRFF